MSALSRKHLTALEQSVRDGRLISCIEHIVNDNTTSNGTMVVRYSLIRKYLKTRCPGLEHLATPSPELVDLVKKQAHDRLSQRETCFVSDSLYVDICDAVRSENSLAARAAKLQLTSGRRIREIYNKEMEVCSCRKYRDKHIRCASFAKKRGEASGCFMLLRGICPVEWISELYDVRARIHATCRSFTNRVNYGLKKINSSYHSHLLRGIHAHLRWNECGKSKHLVGFIQQTLNLESMQVANHYAAYVIGDKFIFPWMVERCTCNEV